MNDRANPSDHNDDEHKKKGGRQEPDKVPLDLPSAQQKARERGRWMREAILKGAVSGAVREAWHEVREALENIDF